MHHNSAHQLLNQAQQSFFRTAALSEEENQLYQAERAIKLAEKRAELRRKITDLVARDPALLGELEKVIARLHL